MSSEADVHVKKDKVFDPTFGLNSHMLGVIVAVIAVIITIRKLSIILFSFIDLKWLVTKAIG